MVNALAAATEDPTSGVRMFEVPRIRGIGEAYRKSAGESAAKLQAVTEKRSTVA